MTHTVSVLVENKPGALARVSNMFARRGFNIESLAVGPTERPRRLAHDAPRRLPGARARADREADAQARQRPPRLELQAGEAVERELALITVGAPTRAGAPS